VCIVCVLEFFRLCHVLPRRLVIASEMSTTTYEGTDMAVQVTAIMIGVEDLARSKKFYGEGLGCSIDQDYPSFVSFNLGEGSSSLALYEREAAAADAGVPSKGSGFRGVSFHYIVGSTDAVDEVIRQAVAAGGDVVKEAAPTGWVFRVFQRSGRLPLEGCFGLLALQRCPCADSCASRRR
jgi:predicted enzyme related to lactoylglutathione lyase